jgi:hypothetical protein
MGARALRSEWLVLALCALLATTDAGRAQAPPDPMQVKATKAALDEICRSDMRAPPTADAKIESQGRIEAEREQIFQIVWRQSENRRFIVRRTFFDPQKPLYFAALYEGEGGRLPRLRLVANDRCALLGGEQIVYDGDTPTALQPLSPALTPRSPPIPFNPPVPAGPAGQPDCLRVGLIDNGVNYLLPSIAARLARSETGGLVGYDFWDGDDLPFDFGVPVRETDPRLSIFAPPVHGTGVASVLLADAPQDLCLAVYRYHPMQDDAVTTELIARASADGVRVLVLSSGRDRPWPGFQQAMRDHPEILFVAASGNDGIDLTRQPKYPMVYAEPNLLVVAATDANGNIWDRSNRGSDLVPLAVPALDLAGLDFSGRDKRLSGTSFAAPRVGALAGALFARNPGLSGAEARNRILELAASVGVETGGLIALTEAQFRGLLADPG